MPHYAIPQSSLCYYYSNLLSLGDEIKRVERKSFCQLKEHARQRPLPRGSFFVLSCYLVEKIQSVAFKMHLVDGIPQFVEGILDKMVNPFNKTLAG